MFPIDTALAPEAVDVEPRAIPLPFDPALDRMPIAMPYCPAADAAAAPFPPPIATEHSPDARAPAVAAVLLAPMATAAIPVADGACVAVPPDPMAIALVCVLELENAPNAMPFAWLATVAIPIAVAWLADAAATSPTAIDCVPEAAAPAELESPDPIAMAFAADALEPATAAPFDEPNAIAPCAVA